MANRSRMVFGAAAIVCGLLFLATARAQSTSPPNTQTGETFALVIGISKYLRLPGGYQLQFADRDARLFADSIKKAGVSPINIKVLVGPDATAAAIKAALGNWLSRIPNPPDTVYIFFSGHGVVEREFGEAYLLAYDSDPKDAFATAVSLNDITRAVNRRIRARQVLIIADAVRRDFFDPDTDGGSGTKLFTEAFGTLANSRPGLSVVLASGLNEFSREGQRWGGAGVFTKYAADALSGAADLNADGSVAGNEFFDFVFKNVADDTSNKQHPWLAATTLAQLTLSRNTTKPGLAASPSAQSQPVTQRQTEVARATTPGPPLSESPAPESPKPVSAPAERSTTPVTAPRQAAKSETPRSSPAGTPATVNRGTPSTKATATGPLTESSKGRPAETTAPKNNGTTTPPRSRKAPVARPGTSRRSAAPPPKSKQMDPGRTVTAAPAVTEAALPSITVTPPPKPPSSPPSVGTVTAQPATREREPVAGSVPTSNAGRIPSPLVLETAAAISAGALIEPKNNSAWDYYQRLTQDPAAASDVSRLRPLLAEALWKAGRALVIGDVRADNVSAKVDEFRRAGQMLARLRTLTPENTESLTLEKLSAAHALIALQFYDEAEKALTQLQSARLAGVENALGLAYLGNYNEWQAERAFKRAIELDANWASPHYNLATLYRSQKKDAVVEFELAAAIDAANVAVLVALADEYFGKEKWVQAADNYRKAIALDPASESLHTKLGHALYSQGLRDDANKEYQKAKELRGKP